MKDRGEWDKYGRPRTIKIDKDFKNVYNEWKEKKITAVKAMELSGMSKATFYRKVKEYKNTSCK